MRNVLIKMTTFGERGFNKLRAHDVFLIWITASFPRDAESDSPSKVPPKVMSQLELNGVKSAEIDLPHQTAFNSSRSEHSMKTADVTVRDITERQTPTTIFFS